jgi:hypothetical protein
LAAWAHQEALVEAVQNGKAERWRRRIEDQRVGGQSVRAWCATHEVREQSFYWWRRRLAVVSQPKAKAVTPAFARVLLQTAESLRLRLGNDRELILPASMPMEQVAELVRALERAS